MRFRVVAHSDVGRVRDQNEDAYLAPNSDEPRLLAVADGMGGHEGGEVAAQLTLEVLESWTQRLAQRGGAALTEAVQDANRTVWSKGRDDPSLQRMGTTLTAAWLDGPHVALAHVGDSRAYLLRGNKLEQLTTDQTLVQQLLDEGTIDEQEAARHPQRSLLLQAIGSEPDIRVDLLDFDLQPGDRLMLATDGLHGVVSDERLEEVLTSEPDTDKACRVLVEDANAAGGHDNITVVILDALPDTSEEPPGGGGPVIVSKPPLDPHPGRRSLRNRLILGGVLAVLVLAVLLGAAALFRSATTRYVVTDSDGLVVIMRGTPGREGEPPTGEIVHRSEVEVASLPSTYQRQLGSGIAVDTLEDAHKVITSISAQWVGPLETPTSVPPSPPEAAGEP